MAADCDAFSRQFKKSREVPFPTCIEEFMILQMMGNITGLTALDLACGEGHYARMLRRQRRVDRKWESAWSYVDADRRLPYSLHQ
jgi:hypothetical protein